MPLLLPPKDPDEVLDYDHEWAPRMVAGDELVAVQTLLEDGDVVIDDVDWLGTVQKYWLSAGTEGVKNRLTLRATTRDGRVMDEGIVIKIKTR